MYLLAFFVSPLAVLLAGKPFQAALNGLIYLSAWFWALFGLGFPLWAIGAAHACFVVHGYHADRRTAALAEAVRQSGGRPYQYQ